MDTPQLLAWLERLGAVYDALEARLGEGDVDVDALAGLHNQIQQHVYGQVANEEEAQALQMEASGRREGPCDG